MRFLVTGATGKVGNAVTRRLIERGDQVVANPGEDSRIGKGALTFLLWEARADNTKAREELGVEFTPWREAGARTVEWIIESGRV